MYAQYSFLFVFYSQAILHRNFCLLEHLYDFTMHTLLSEQLILSTKIILIICKNVYVVGKYLARKTKYSNNNTDREASYKYPRK